MFIDDIPRTLEGCIRFTNRHYDMIVREFETYSSFQFRYFGSVKISKTRSDTYALRKELDSLRERDSGFYQVLGEPPSALFADEVTVTYHLARAKIGAKVVQKHDIKVRKELQPLFKTWIKYGSKFGSSGAFYPDFPNKKGIKAQAMIDAIEKGADITKLFERPDYKKYAKEFWLMFTAYRLFHSTAYLRENPDIFAEHNPNSGTGWKYKGSKFERSQLGKRLRDEQFANEVWTHCFSISLARAYGYITRVPIMIETTSTNFAGVRGVRADGDILGTNYSDGKALFDVEAVARTINVDGTNIWAANDKKQLGKSLNQLVIEKLIAGHPQ